MTNGITAGAVAKRKASERKLREIGERLVWLREAMGQTQAAFARSMNLRVEMLNRWERGTRQPNLDLLCILCRETGATTDFILDGRVGPLMNDELIKARLASIGLAADHQEAVQRAIVQSRAGFAAALEAGLKQAAQPARIGPLPHIGSYRRSSSVSSSRPRKKTPD